MAPVVVLVPVIVLLLDPVDAVPGGSSTSKSTRRWGGRTDWDVGATGLALLAHGGVYHTTESRAEGGSISLSAPSLPSRVSAMGHPRDLCAGTALALSASLPVHWMRVRPLYGRLWASS